MEIKNLNLDPSGPASMFKHLGKTVEPKQIPRAQILKDLKDLILSMPLTDEQAIELYRAAQTRVRFKPCSVCLKIKPVCDGEMQYDPSGDLTKPKRFICERCK